MNTVSPFPARFFILPILAAALLASAGCARLVVTSSPDGATVLWSPDGLPPWRPWPPLHWSEYIAYDDTTTTRLTPLSQRGPHADYLFIRVEKPGYYPVRPRLAGMRMFRACRLDFELRETPEQFARRQREAGLVPYRGEWVNPAKQGLVEYQGEWMPEAERTRRIQRARGLVEFEGRWLTPAEYETAFAARQRERGLVLFKDRWVPEPIRAREEAIDDVVARLVALEPLEMLPPKVLGRGADSERAGLGLINAADRPTRWLLSGPISRALDLPAGAQIAPEELSLLPGRYTVAVFLLEPTTGTAPAEAAAPQARPFTESPPPLLPESQAAPPGLTLLVQQPVSAGFQYQLSYSAPPLDNGSE